MGSLTIRNLDDEVKKGLRIRAALNERSMEEEARLILRDAVMRPTDTLGLASAIRKRLEPVGGVELDLPRRQPINAPPNFR